MSNIYIYILPAVEDINMDITSEHQQVVYLASHALYNIYYDLTIEFLMRCICKIYFTTSNG